jgi:hypothetical protein
MLALTRSESDEYDNLEGLISAPLGASATKSKKIGSLNLMRHNYE